MHMILLSPTLNNFHIRLILLFYLSLFDSICVFVFSMLLATFVFMNFKFWWINRILDNLQTLLIEFGLRTKLYLANQIIIQCVDARVRNN